MKRSLNPFRNSGFVKNYGYWAYLSTIKEKKLIFVLEFGFDLIS